MARRSLFVVQAFHLVAILGWLAGLFMTFTSLNTLSFWLTFVASVVIASLAMVVLVLALSKPEQRVDRSRIH